MVNDYRPTSNAKSRLHESKVEKKLKGLGFKFPSIESILKSAELPETFPEIVTFRSCCRL
jgi:hypothetical protein